MRKLWVLMVGVLFVSVVSCVTSNSDNGNSSNNNAQSRVRTDVPSWFLLPPTASDSIYAVGYAKRTNMQLAMQIAANRARDEISRVIGVKVSNMVKDFLEEAGVTGESVATEYNSSVSRSITDNFLSGTRVANQELYTATDGSYEAFVLVQVQLADMSNRIDEVMRNNAAAYARLQANRGFDELTQALREMNGSDPALTPAAGNTDAQ